ncbi:hypothetical protein [Geodermatophilus sp. TF02-6]|uniref:hypothetical protein n=1 Tax=Geodermatophilus sp. TF02-6 TaxID=2250575 RepID=UPI0011BF7CC5|nr:hypothetical protein [Geodermatophilus sp. TF02-6]
MDATDQVFGGFAGATGSDRVEQALEGFYADSSDSRKKLGELLDRGSGLLRGLAEGTQAVDRSLADALPVMPPATVVPRAPETATTGSPQ